MYWLVLEVESAIRLGHETHCSAYHDRTVVTEYLVLPTLTYSMMGPGLSNEVEASYRVKKASEIPQH